MGDLGDGTASAYPGTLDTNNTKESASTQARFDVPNDTNAAMIKVQTEMGTDPAGTLTDVKTYLQTEHSTDGTHSDITPDKVTMGGNMIWKKGGDIASATTFAIGTDGNYFDVTGTTTITAFSGGAVGMVAKLHFDDTLTLTHHSTNLVLPVGSNIQTWNGLELEFTQFATDDWRLTGGINSSASPSFYVHRDGVEQSNITADDKIDWDTEGFDVGPCFGTDALGSNGSTHTNAAAGRFAPGVAGKYLLSAAIQWKSGSFTDADPLYIRIYKNGVVFKQVYMAAAGTTDGQTSTITVVVDANGSSDYFEIYAQNTARNTSDIVGTTDGTYWTGCKVD